MYLLLTCSALTGLLNLCGQTNGSESDYSCVYDSHSHSPLCLALGLTLLCEDIELCPSLGAGVTPTDGLKESLISLQIPTALAPDKIRY